MTLGKRPIAYASLIETLPNGTSVLYPFGKSVLRMNAGRYYVDTFQSKNKILLERVATLQDGLKFLSAALCLVLPQIAVKPRLDFIVGLLFLQAVLIFMALSFSVRAKIITTLFPKVKHVAQSVDPAEVESILEQWRKINKVFPLLMFTVIVYFAWNSVPLPLDAAESSSQLVSWSSLQVLAASLFGTVALFALVPSRAKPGNFAKVFAPLYLVLSVAWIGFLISRGYAWDASAEVGGVEWRTEISKDDEPNTWPFKEPRYMLGCKGLHGDYMVYLVKFEDIMYKPDRPKGFVPRYYLLNKSWKHWKRGELELTAGQSPAVFQKYIDKSLELCRQAEKRQKEARKGLPMSPPVAK